MTWHVEFCDEFDAEYLKLAEPVRVEMLATLKFLKAQGPLADRPSVGKLDGSKHANMKELRFDADNGVWRVAFAFDPDRKAILLCAGDKAGTNERRFYKGLIREADVRFDLHLENRRKAKEG
jgi:hypothetical protein